MKINKLTILLAFLALALASCRKDHYDVSNVHGVNAEGEMLLPVASKSFSVKDLIERFELMDVISFNEAGDMSFTFDFEVKDAVSGENMLRFKDVNLDEHFTFDNPYPITTPPFVDTTLSFTNTIEFESEHVFVHEALMKSGRIDFTVASNVGNVQHVVLRSANIKNATGHDFELDAPVHANTFGFDLDGLRYVTDEANELEISFDLELNMHGISDPELYVDVNIMGSDLAFSEMKGYVDQYSSRNRLDTIFSLFPNEMDGVLEVEGVRIKISERNTFDLGARFVIDTATVYCQHLAPYSIFDPLPLTIDFPPMPQYTPVFNKTISGKINANGGRLFASTDFIVNPGGNSGLVTVTDSNHIDVLANVEIPFSFNLDDIHYLDTVNMNLANIEFPDLIEKLTFELTFTSLLPLNLDASFYMYDSESQRITDTLLTNAALIEASFDGQPKETTVTLTVDEERIDDVLHSDRIIMRYDLDSGAHDVDLNVNQRLDLSLKGKVSYKGNVEF